MKTFTQLITAALGLLAQTGKCHLPSGKNINATFPSA